MLILTKGFKQSGENPIWKKLISLPFLPAFVVCVIILSIFSVPFWWLYPEKHMTRIDFEGNDEEKAKLREYREILRKKSIWRRFAERLGLAPKAAPPWPFSTKH